MKKIPNSMTSIEEDVFSNCVAVASISIPKQLESRMHRTFSPLDAHNRIKDKKFT